MNQSEAALPPKKKERKESIRSNFNTTISFSGYGKVHSQILIKWQAMWALCLWMHSVVLVCHRYCRLRPKFDVPYLRIIGWFMVDIPRFIYQHLNYHKILAVPLLKFTLDHFYLFETSYIKAYHILL